MKFSSIAALGAMAVAVGAATKRAQRPLSLAAGQIGRAVEVAVRPVRRPPHLLIRLYYDAREDRLFAVAAGVAFYALLALVPSLAAAVSLFGLFADPERLAKLPSDLISILPYDAVTLVQQQAQRLASQPAPALSAKLALSLAVSLWSASAAVRSLFDALNVIGEQEETRSTVRLYATAIFVTVAGVVALSLAVVVIGADPKFVALGAFSHETVWLWGVLRWPLFFVFAVVVIAILYWIGPGGRRQRFAPLLPGAAFAALLWAAGSYVFGWYVATLGNYTATYGSLATVVVVMTWLWVSAAIILLGAELNDQLARRGAPRARK